MAQAGYTPLQLYYSTTSSQVPVNTNLQFGELAINITDGKLYYKDNTGTVQLLADKAATAGVTSITFGSTGLTPSSPTNGAVTVAGTLGAGYGGTGLNSYTAGDILYSTGTTSLGKLGLGTTNYVLTAGALAPQWSQYVGVANGGTGQTSYTDGQLLIGNTATGGLSKATLTAGSGVSITNGNGTISIAATGSGGTVTSVSWTGGIVSVANGTTTPAFTIAGTSGGIPYFSSGTTWASSAALAANAIVLGGGAGAAPATTTTGTGVVTAIGIAVNTSGGLVTQSGTLTSSALLLGGGSGSAITSTTTGTGVVTALGNAANATGGFTTINGTATLTNKRITPRIGPSGSTTSFTSPLNTWTSDSFDAYEATAQANDLTIAVDSGTPTDGQKITFRITSDATPRVITFTGGATGGFKPVGVTLTTSGSNFTYTLTANKTTYFGCVYNTTSARWEMVALSQEA